MLGGVIRFWFVTFKIHRPQQPHRRMPDGHRREQTSENWSSSHDVDTAVPARLAVDPAGQPTLHECLETEE